MWLWFHKLASPPHAYRLLGTLAPWFGWPALALILLATWWGLVKAPRRLPAGRRLPHPVRARAERLDVDVHLRGHGDCGGDRPHLAHQARARGGGRGAPIGASFTFLALATGSIWGKPMWGTWWVWDARLTSELILLFLYLGYMALRSSFDDPQRADRASAVLAIVGVINVPIIHYSVEWWTTLHQPASVTKIDKPSIAIEMLVPLFIMIAGLPAVFRLGDLAAPARRDPAP